MSEGLKRCDVCGGCPEAIASIGGWIIVCNKKVCFEQQGYYTKEEAIKAYNSPNPEPKEIEK